LKQLGEDWKLTVAVPEELSELQVEKGSVAVDGISLTVANTPSRTFEVAVVPHTMQSTTLQHRGAGDKVNIECDLLGKYVRKFTSAAEADEGDGGALTVEKLKEEGY
jgi:riboflavin synthase